uniref:Ig-like domain-containing protein n=1 Tax=Gasterosteus aculeatus aculeatus TaxID=481459 RepID=A0AAQ4P119_GASAC
LIQVFYYCVVSEVSVKAGGSISIPCLYSSQYTNHVKYLCKGYYWISCTYKVRTDKNNSVTIDTNVRNVFSVTMRGLKTESSGWYLCVSGNLQFPVRLTPQTPQGSPQVSTVTSEVSVKAGGSISIPCLYSSQHTNHVKYLCKGYYWNYCTFAVRTDQKNSAKFSISDDKIRRIFTVTVNELTNDDSGWYLCDSGNPQFPVRLTVTEQPTTSKYYNYKRETYRLMNVCECQ